MGPSLRLAVIDASVAVKWFIAEEDGADEAASLLDDHAEGRCRLVAPALLIHELMHVLRRVERSRKISAPALDGAMAAFFDADVGLVAPDRELVSEAVRLIAECGVSTFDSAYAALAAVLDCELVTADRGLARAAGTRCRVRLLS